MKNNWLVQQLRLSVFPEAETSDASIDLWPVLGGLEKEKQTIDSKTGTITYEGIYMDFKLILVVNPVKVDLILTVPNRASIENNKTVMNYLGTFSEGLKIFQPIVETWFANKFPEVKRLAFGAQLMKEMTSREEVYKYLSQYIPFVLDPKKMSDFNLQLNLLTKSQQVKDLGLNRLSKWNSLKVTPELSVVGNPKTSHEYPTINLCHLELDINTSQENKEKIDKKVLTPLYAELVSLGAEISEKGVIDHAN